MEFTPEGGFDNAMQTVVIIRCKTEGGYPAGSGEMIYTSRMLNSNNTYFVVYSVEGNAGYASVM